ncbi:unnamed protein product [Closterium sp. Yama58-4]|nr:unnamed protein product [Closterium sp. Yama58-4]
MAALRNLLVLLSTFLVAVHLPAAVTADVANPIFASIFGHDLDSRETLAVDVRKNVNVRAIRYKMRTLMEVNKESSHAGAVRDMAADATVYALQGGGADADVATEKTRRMLKREKGENERKDEGHDWKDEGNKRKEEENKRKDEENKRRDDENKRKDGENKRKDEENKRKDEDNKKKDEKNRRKAKENKRKDEENNIAKMESPKSKSK